MVLYKCRYSLIDLNKTNIKPFKTNKMNKFKTHPQNQYKGIPEQEVNEVLKDFAAFIVLMLITVLGLMFLCTIN